jgi:hypothetical protein
MVISCIFILAFAIKSYGIYSVNNNHLLKITWLRKGFKPLSEDVYMFVIDRQEVDNAELFKYQIYDKNYNLISNQVFEYSAYPEGNRYYHYHIFSHDEQLAASEKAIIVSKIYYDNQGKYYTNQYGFMDMQGNMITKIKYFSINPFSGGLASIQQNKQWGFIGLEGNRV